MSEAIIVALITAAASVVCQLIISAKASEKSRIQASATQQLFEFKLDKLTEEQRKYNHLQERTYKLEELITLHDEKIKVANNRIADLERRQEG